MVDASTPSFCPLISVIVAVFNGEKTIQHCIDSVVTQTYPNLELIVVDGASNDSTLQIVKANEINICDWISEKDTGVYNAWNKGLDRARGEWICFLGADDFFWDKDVIATLVSHLEKLPEDIRIVYGQVMLLNNSGVPLYPIGDPWPEVREKFLQVMCVPHPGLLHKRSLFEEHGTFDETYRISGDYEFLLRELRSSNAWFVPLIAVGMRLGGISSLPENSLKALLETREAKKKNGIDRIGGYWLSAMARICVRVFLGRLVGESAVGKILDFGRRIRGLPPHWTKLQ